MQYPYSKSTSVIDWSTIFSSTNSRSYRLQMMDYIYTPEAATNSWWRYARTSIKKRKTKTDYRICKSWPKNIDLSSSYGCSKKRRTLFLEQSGRRTKKSRYNFITIKKGEKVNMIFCFLCVSTQKCILLTSSKLQIMGRDTVSWANCNQFNARLLFSEY